AAIADDQDLPHRTSVVDLKFPSFLWQPRLGTSNPNHTRFQRVASVLSNPKFAQSQARDAANFGFGTLDQRFELCGDLVPALTALPRQRLGVVAPQDIVGAQQSDRRGRKAVLLTGGRTPHAPAGALADAPARRRRLAQFGVSERVEDAVGDDLSFAGQPAGDGARVVLAGHDQRGAMAQERSEKTRLLQIAGRIMQREQPPLRLGDKPDHAVTAIADIEIAFMRNTARERRPGDAVMAERRTAIAARLNAMAARCQCSGERDKRRLGA